MSPLRFTLRPVSSHPGDIDAMRVAQHIVDHDLPAHITEAAEKAAAEAYAETGDRDEAVRAAWPVVSEWLYSGGLQDLR